MSDSKTSAKESKKKSPAPDATGSTAPAKKVVKVLNCLLNDQEGYGAYKCSSLAIAAAAVKAGHFKKILVCHTDPFGNDSITPSEIVSDGYVWLMLRIEDDDASNSMDTHSDPPTENYSDRPPAPGEIYCPDDDLSIQQSTTPSPSDITLPVHPGQTIPMSRACHNDCNSDVSDPGEADRDSIYIEATLGWRVQYATNAVAALCKPNSLVRGITPRHWYPYADFCDLCRDVRAPQILDRCEHLHHFPSQSANHFRDEQRILSQNAEQHLL